MCKNHGEKIINISGTLHCYYCRKPLEGDFFGEVKKRKN